MHTHMHRPYDSAPWPQTYAMELQSLAPTLFSLVFKGRTLTSAEGTGLWNKDQRDEINRGPHSKQASNFCSPAHLLHLNNKKTEDDIVGGRAEKQNDRWSQQSVFQI